MMALNATVRARVDVNLKAEVEEILSQIGITTSQAINIFLNSIKRERGIPFELKIPNDETLNAMKEARDGIGETVTLDEFLNESSLDVKSI
jgi:DNA-damage-inducible protein J